LARHSGVNEVSGPRWAINGWYAADHHGLRSIADLNRKPVTIVTDGSLMERMERWKCVAADPRDGLFIIETTNDTSVLDAALASAGSPGVAVGSDTARSRMSWVDPIQCAIDIARDPQQGYAQASAIVDRLCHDLVQT
jgi:hypothetical protein